MFAAVASLALVAFLITGCSGEEDEPPGATTDAAPPMVIPDNPITGPATVVVPNMPAPAAADTNCCSCAVVAGQTYADPQLPCLFDYPVSWASTVRGDLPALAMPPRRLHTWLPAALLLARR